MLCGNIVTKVLLNGLTILVRPVDTIPKVSIQLWYHVGSKNEMTGEKGNAHLIEHMIFKGTDMLSETDIKDFTHKFSGYANAFTYLDWTTYIFDFPSQSWREPLPILANCMRNCRFETEMLNSELKVVIQELKRNRDNDARSLMEVMMASIYFDHPYHYPTIGFKQDLWSLKRDDLFAFYKKHYVPNNATLVVVGDVNPEEVFAEVEKVFGSIPADPNYKHQEFYHSKSLISQNVTIYRDIQQPYSCVVFELPGAREKYNYPIEVLANLLAGGKSSLLYKKLVDDLKLVANFSAQAHFFEESGLLFLNFYPKDAATIDQIGSIIQDYINDMIKNGISKEDLLCAEKMYKINLLSSLETFSDQAMTIGQDYLFTKDPSHTFKMFNQDSKDLEKEIQFILKKYFNGSVMHKGRVLPLTDQAKVEWKKMQELSDQEDARILDGRTRTIPVEEQRYTTTLQVKEKKKFNYPKPEKFSLSNGVRVFAFNNTNIPKIEMILSLKATSDYRTEEFPGLYLFMVSVMAEGTKKYPGHLFAQEVEKNGIGIDIKPGFIEVSCLKEDFLKALELLQELLMHATFEAVALEKVRDQLLMNLKIYWDKPSLYGKHLAAKILYKNHPYSICFYGTEESLSKITRDQIYKCYQDYISAYQARIALVGDFGDYDIKKELERALGAWPNREVKDLEYPEIKKLTSETFKHVINRDQVSLIYVGKSITKTDPDYQKLLLFDQIFSASQMASRLFKIREETGLFYSIYGSTTHWADKQPGMFCVSTMVSLDKKEEAKKVIVDLLKTIVDSLTEEELIHAKKAVLEEQVNLFEKNRGAGYVFLELDTFNLPDDYLEQRVALINNVTLAEVKEAARKILNLQHIALLEIGRV